MVVRPWRQPFLGGVELSWWTIEGRPPAAALGLTGRGGLVKCDRMAYRFRAIDGDVVRWVEVRGTLPHDRVLHLEAARGARPATWWVAFAPVTVEAA